MRSKRIRMVLLVILLGIFLFSGYQLVRYYGEDSLGKSLYREAQTEFVEIHDQPQEDLTLPAITVDTVSLTEANPEIAGWIYIPDTVINYPLLEGVDNSKYLNTAYNGQKSQLGSIFIDMYNATDLSDRHTIVYGHNSKTKVMFGSLHEYANQTYYEQHPRITIVTPQETLNYEIFSAYTTEADNPLYRVSFKDETDFSSFIKKLAESSVVSTQVIPTATDRILTLSTCTGTSVSERFVVHAKLIKKE